MFRWLTKTSERSTHRRALTQLPGTAAAVLVVSDMVARLAFRLVNSHGRAEVIYGLITYAVVAVAIAGFGSWWARWYLLPTVWGYLAAAAAPAAVVIGALGGWVSGEGFVEGSWTLIVGRILLNYAVMAAGAVVGVLTTVALGHDVTSRAWSAHADKLLAGRGPIKPRT